MQDDKEYQDACNLLIAGELWGHFYFWVFMISLLSFVYGVVWLTAQIPETVNIYMGIR